MELTYPRHMHKRGGVYYVVSDADAYASALADGWLDRPSQDWPRVDVYREWTPSCDWMPADEPQSAGPSQFPESAPPPTEDVIPSSPRYPQTEDERVIIEPVLRRGPGRPRKNT